MNDDCLEHTYTSTFSNSLIQSSIVFIFLTIFFFTYVSPTEKEEFVGQIQMIVDNIYNPYSEEIKKDFSDQTQFKKGVVYAVIDTAEDNLNKDAVGEIADIDKNNGIIFKNSILTVLTVLIITLFILLVFAMFGYCIPIKNFLKEGFFILLFVFLTEFIFLNLITKNYISISSDVVKKKVLQSVVNYVDNR